MVRMIIERGTSNCESIRRRKDLDADDSLYTLYYQQPFRIFSLLSFEVFVGKVSKVSRGWLACSPVAQPLSTVGRQGAFCDTAFDFRTAKSWASAIALHMVNP